MRADVNRVEAADGIDELRFLLFALACGITADEGEEMPVPSPTADRQTILRT